MLILAQIHQNNKLKLIIYLIINQNKIVFIILQVQEVFHQNN